MNNKFLFGHEKLVVYQKTLEFIEWSDKICSKVIQIEFMNQTKSMKDNVYKVHRFFLIFILIIISAVPLIHISIV